MRVLRADRYATVPWRNGGGTTREIASFRDLELHHDFLWRLSIANVDRSGPFSRFDGVDRTLAMLSGGGMLLRSPAKDTPVKAGTLPYAFDGETEIACELLAGPTIDLNVMTRRGYCTHSMRRERFAGWLPVKASADRTMVVSNSVVELSALGRDRLAPLDAVADIAPGVTLEFFSDSVAEIFIIELTGR